MANDTEATGTALPVDRPTTSRQLAEQVGHLWWVPLVAGLVSIGFGIAILVSDWTVHALVVVTGIALVVRGLAVAFHPSLAVEGAHERLGAGFLTIVAGALLIFWPKPTLLVLATVFGICIALSGCFHIVVCVARRKEMAQWGIGLGLGVLELLLGIWVMRRPDVTLSIVVTVIGLWTVISGVIYCVQAFEIRNAAREYAEGPASVDVRDW